jgi:polysaccharide biosynthesis protein PslG
MTSVSRVLLWVALLAPLPLVGAAASAGPPPNGPAPAAHVLVADDQIYRLAADGGYERIVQVFPWRDIEPVRDQWHWEQPDFAIRAADYYGFKLIMRLDHPPDWALAPSGSGGVPPVDLDAYANLVAVVAERYRGRAPAYIIWNEPNLSLEWAGRPPDPAAYTTLLCRAYAAIKVADPNATVVSAGLAPTNGGDGALDDRAFLRAMLDAGAGACFDVLGAHVYGFGHPPDDPRGRHDGLNMARLADLRRIMEARDERAKPVWITELGWTTDGAGSHAWQTVSAEQQAGYLAQAWQQIKLQWPWVRVVTVWNLSRGLSPDNEMAGYSLLNADGSPKLAYDVMRGLLAAEKDQGAVDAAGRLPAAGKKAGAKEIPILAADEIAHLGDNQ